MAMSFGIFSLRVALLTGPVFLQDIAYFVSLCSCWSPASGSVTATDASAKPSVDSAAVFLHRWHCEWLAARQAVKNRSGALIPSTVSSIASFEGMTAVNLCGVEDDATVGKKSHASAVVFVPCFSSSRPRLETFQKHD
jgi:hypothetical protein